MAGLAISAYLAIVFIVLFIACVFIVTYYAQPDFPWHTYITAVIGYFAAFAILLLVPIDIGVVVFDRRSTTPNYDSNYHHDMQILSTAYDTFFTMVFVLGSFVLVFEEYFNTDGYFTLFGRLKSSFLRMSYDSFVPMIVGVIILGILIGQHVMTSNTNALKLTAIIITNTIYELALMFLLGYGFVEFPRSIWLESDLDRYLLSIQTKAATEFKNISEAQLSVSLVVSDVLKTKTQLSSYNDPALMEAMDILIAECPTEFRSERMGKVAVDKKGNITIDTLAQLRTRLNTTKDLYKMAQGKAEWTKFYAFRLEDMVKAKNEPNSKVIHWSITGQDSTESEYNWEIVYRPILLKFASVVCGVLSILSFLGVVCSMNGVSNEVSVYYLTVHSDGVRPAGVVLFILITLSYTVYIAVWALFQMKFGAANQLVPGSTTPESLSFNVRMVARLAAPLAFFYLGWLSENGLRSGSYTNNEAPSIIELENVTYTNTTTGQTSWEMVNVTVSQSIYMPSAFSKFYQLQNIKTVQNIFGTVFPIVLYVVLILFVLNIFNRLLIMIKLDNYQFGAEIITDEQLREGKRQLERHRKITERKYKRGELRNFITSLAGTSDQPSMFSRLLGFGGNSANGNKEQIAGFGDEKPTIKEPAPLNGMLERKGAFNLAGSWKEMFAEVRSPGFLHFYKDKRSADQLRGSVGNENDPNQQHYVLDLRLIMNFIVPERKNKDNLILELELGDETVRLKFKSATEVDLWHKSLQEWKDFNIDYGNLYPNGVNDVEEGGGAVSAGRNSSSALKPASTTANPLASTVDDLDNIQVDEGSDDEDKGVRPLMKGILSSTGVALRSGGGFFSLGKKKKEETHEQTNLMSNNPKPKGLEGWLEKKGHSKVSLGENWQKRYVRIDDNTGKILYFKSSNSSEEPSGNIDIRIADITPYDKNGKPDYSRFNIDTGDKTYKFRAMNETDGRRWLDGLNAWKDYFLMNMIN